MKMNNFSRRKLKKTACALTAGMMFFSVGAMFTGCGNGSSGNNNAIVDQAEAMKTLAYKVSEIDLNDVNLNGGVVSKNGKLYGVTYSYTNKDDIYLSSYSIAVMDMEGNVEKTIPVYEQTKENEWGYINGELNIDGSGNITCMLSVSSYDEETSNYNESNQLLTFDTDGNIVNSLDIDNIVTEEDNNNNMWFQSYVMDSEGNLFCNLYRCIRVLDKTGKVLFTTEKLDSDNAWIQGIFLTNKGVPAISTYEYTNDKSVSKIKEIDINAQGFGAEYELPAGTYLNQAYAGSGDYLCYTSSDTGIAGIRASDLQRENVLNLLNLGVDNSQIDEFSICEDGSFITLGWNYTGRHAKRKISIIRPVDSSEVKEKKILSLGCFYMDWNVRSAIADFNKTNEEYTISVTSFNDSNDTSDYQAALTKFNNELLAGNVPDILLINSSMPYDSYVAKGLFTDLYSFMESDSELHREDFLPNVLTALETNGKLYSLTPSVYISTYAAKTSLLGGKTSLTAEDAQAILAQMGDDVQLTSYPISSMEVLNNAITYGEFVDYKNGTCNFDTPEFVAILEMANTFPKEIDYEAMYNENPNYWMEQETACRDNKALLYSAGFYDFDSYTRIKQAIFNNEDITFVGFPGVGGENGVNGKMGIYTQLAVSEKSAFKEGAWEFIKRMILDSVSQEEVEIYNYYSNDEDAEPVMETRWVSGNSYLPVLTDQLEKLGTQATDPYKRFDENGNIVPQQNSYYIGDQEVELKPITQEEVDELIAYLKTVNSVAKYDESLNTIIEEEASSYFAGTKSADETAKIIQSRVNIYMSEQYR